MDAFQLRDPPSPCEKGARSIPTLVTFSLSRTHHRDAMVDILVGTLIPIIYFISDARAVDLDRVEWWSYIHKKTLLASWKKNLDAQRVCCMDRRQKQICVTITFSFLSMRRVRFDIASAFYLFRSPFHSLPCLCWAV